MSKLIQAGLIALAVVAGISTTYAATPVRDPAQTQDQWVQTVHLDPSSPAGQYFGEMQHDGE